MPNPGSAVASFQPPLKTPPTGVTAALQHQRAVVTGAEAPLSSFLTGGVIPHGTNVPLTYPHGVFIQAEAGSTCYITINGAACSATLGLAIGVAPTGSYFEILPSAFAADLVRVFSPGTADLQVIFYY